MGEREEGGGGGVGEDSGARRQCSLWCAATPCLPPRSVHVSYCPPSPPTPPHPAPPHPCLTAVVVAHAEEALPHKLLEALQGLLAELHHALVQVGLVQVVLGGGGRGGGGGGGRWRDGGGRVEGKKGRDEWGRGRDGWGREEGVGGVQLTRAGEGPGTGVVRWHVAPRQQMGAALVSDSTNCQRCYAVFCDLY